MSYETHCPKCNRILIKKEALFLGISKEKGLGKAWPKGYKANSFVCRVHGYIEFFLDDKGFVKLVSKNYS